MNAEDTRTQTQPPKAANSQLDFLIEKEKEYKRRLNDYKKALQIRFEELSLDYEEKLNQIQSTFEKKVLEIPRTYQKEVKTIEKEYGEKLREELQKIEREWLKNKKQRAFLFLRAIQDQIFYD